jgi:hypothetical protein
MFCPEFLGSNSANPSIVKIKNVIPPDLCIANACKFYPVILEMFDWFPLVEQHAKECNLIFII